MSDEFRVVLFSRDRAREQFITAMNHAACMLDNGDKVLLTVGPALDSIGTKQRGFYHAAVLQQISEQVRVNGDRFVLAIWKEYYRAKFLPDTWEMRKLPRQKRATPKRVRHSTEELGPKAYSELIDRVIADAQTEWSAEFHFIAEEREGVRYVAPARKPTKQAAEVA